MFPMLRIAVLGPWVPVSTEWSEGAHMTPELEGWLAGGKPPSRELRCILAGTEHPYPFSGGRYFLSVTGQQACLPFLWMELLSLHSKAVFCTNFLKKHCRMQDKQCLCLSGRRKWETLQNYLSKHTYPFLTAKYSLLPSGLLPPLACKLETLLILI